MTVSTLALKKSDYESEVGYYLGFGRGVNFDETAWSASKTRTIQLDVASGLRRFYWVGHPWSFLNPVADIALTEGNQTVTLPDDFGGVNGGTKALVLDSNGQRLSVLQFTSAPRVEQMYLDSASTGSPRMVAQRPIKGIPAGQMQKSELVVYPAADQDYTLRFHYFFTPQYLLDTAMPYAYGGVEHHETILECCLAVAEARRDNSLTVHSMEAEKLLQKSIQIDRRRQPKTLGYNADRSDNQLDAHWCHQDWSHGLATQDGVEINGVIYN